MKFLTALLLTLVALPAAALELGPRRIEVSGALDTKAGVKLATDLVKLNEASKDPIYLLVTASGGSAQGVMVVADAIRALESPVVAVVLAPAQGAGAALPLFADRVVMLPSAALVLTEVDYEGVARPPEVKTPPAPDAKPPSKSDVFLQKVRADYLARFWTAVARRLGDKSGAALQADVEAQGGRIVTADEALKKKIAFEVVSTLETPRVASEKTELKVTTTRTQTRTVPPTKAPSTN